MIMMMMMMMMTAQFNTFTYNKHIYTVSQKGDAILFVITYSNSVSEFQNERKLKIGQCLAKLWRSVALFGSRCTSTTLIVVGFCSLQQCLQT